MADPTEYEKRRLQLSEKFTAGIIDEDTYVRMLEEVKRLERAGKPLPTRTRPVTGHRSPAADPTREPQPSRAAQPPSQVLLWSALAGTATLCVVLLLVVVWIGFRQVTNRDSLAAAQSPQSASPSLATPQEPSTNSPPPGVAQSPPVSQPAIGPQGPSGTPGQSPPSGTGSASGSSPNSLPPETTAPPAIAEGKPSDVAKSTPNRTETASPKEDSESPTSSTPAPLARADEKPAETTPPVAANADNTPQDPPASASTSSKRLEYRWQPGKTYTYYVRQETESGTNVQLQSGAAVYTAAEAGPRHEVDAEVKATATAFVVHPDGYLLTCAHCVEDAASFEVAIGGQKYAGKVIALDEENDLAIIQIPAKNLTSLPLADSDKVEVGEDVRALGFPMSSILGDSIKMTRGTISGIDKSDDQRVFQVDAAINPGNSGGPLLRENGDVIGVNFAKFGGEMVTNVGLAVPINTVRPLLKRHKVTAVAATDGEKLSGPELVKRVSASCALLTVNSIHLAKCYELTCRSRMSNFNRMKNQPENMSRKLGLREGLANPGDSGSMVADIYGRVVETKFRKGLKPEDSRLAFLAIDRLPVGGKKFYRESQMTSFELELETTVTEPAKGQPKSSQPPFGPRTPGAPGSDPFDSFGGRGLGVGPRFGPSSPFGPGRDPKKNQPAPPPTTKTTKKQIVIPAREEFVLNISEAHDNQITVLRKYSFKTVDTKSELPAIEITGSGKTVFDTELGVPRKMDYRSDIVIGKGKDRYVKPIKLTFELIDDSDLNRYLRPEEISASEVNQLLADIQKKPDPKDAGKRDRAIDRLLKVAPVEGKSAQVTKVMESLLSDRSETVRSNAARVLAAWGDAESIPVWVKLLSDSAQSVRRTALQELPDYKDERLAAAIAAFCVDPANTRERTLPGMRGTSAGSRDAGMQKLRDMGEVAEKAVIGLLEHANAVIRKEAADILRANGTEASLPALEKLAKSEDRADAVAGRDAIKALCIRTGNPEPDLPPLPEEATASRTQPGAGTPGGRPNPSGGLGSTASGGSDSRSPADLLAEKMEEMKKKAGDPASRRAANSSGKKMELGSTPEQWLAVLKEGETRLKRDAAEKLAAFPPKETPSREIAEALESLTTTDDHFLRLSVIKALGVWGTKESITTLIGLLNHQETFTQGEAIKALAHFKDDKAAQALAGRIGNFFGRREASDGLKMMGSMAEKYVVKLLDDKDASVRKEAVAILKEIGTQKSVNTLQAAGKKDSFSLGKACEEAVLEINKRAREPRSKKTGT